MIEDLHISEFFPRYPVDRDRLRSYLAKHHLKLDEDVQVAFCLLDECDQIRACGCAAGSLLKCFAVEPGLRGKNALGLLISRLVQNRFAVGLYDLFIITRIENRDIFARCGFFPLAETEKLVLLENQSEGPKVFTTPLFVPGDETKTIGALVMNCNPFTLGHRALVEFAARQCGAVHLFVLEEDCSFFSTDVRLRLVQEGTAHLPNVRVHSGGPYMISSVTFPTYFLKEGESAAQLQSELDITLFAHSIAPPLNITRRYAGEEPFDSTTAIYNQTMQRILPQYGIHFEELPRYRQNGITISASRVRKLLQEKGACEEVASLVPETTWRFLKANF